jgi:hypothetical protein
MGLYSPSLCSMGIRVDGSWLVYGSRWDRVEMLARRCFGYWEGME